MPPELSEELLSMLPPSFYAGMADLLADMQDMEKTYVQILKKAEKRCG